MRKGQTEWNEKKKSIVRGIKNEWDSIPKLFRINLRQKIIIFIDQPHMDLLSHLRSLLSHDRRSIRVKIADKTKEGGNRTKTVELVGFPTLVFNSAQFTMDEQERTRLWLLSPEMTQTKYRASLELLAVKLANRREFELSLFADRNRRALQDHIRELKEAYIEEILLTKDDRDYIIDRFFEEHETLAPRYQRDLPRLIALCKAHALLNFKEREVTEHREVWATRDDVEAGYELYTLIGESNELGLPPQIYNLWTEKLKPILDTGAGLIRARAQLNCKHIMKMKFNI